MKNILKIVLALIFLVIFNGLFFYLGGTVQTQSNWISYGFIHASYLCILLTPLFCRKNKGLEVLSYSLYLRAFVYFLIELVTGITCILVSPENHVWPLIIQSIMLLIFLVFQIMGVLANEATVSSVKKQGKESFFIQNMSQRIRTCMRNISDVNAKKQVEKCYDAINNCSIQSYLETKDVDIKLQNAVESLCFSIENEDNEHICKNAKNIINVIQERNAIIRKCRINL